MRGNAWLIDWRERCKSWTRTRRGIPGDLCVQARKRKALDIFGNRREFSAEAKKTLSRIVDCRRYGDGASTGWPRKTWWRLSALDLLVVSGARKVAIGWWPRKLGGIECNLALEITLCNSTRAAACQRPNMLYRTEFPLFWSYPIAADRCRKITAMRSKISQQWRSVFHHFVSQRTRLLEISDNRSGIARIAKRATICEFIYRLCFCSYCSGLTRQSSPAGNTSGNDTERRRYSVKPASLRNGTRELQSGNDMHHYNIYIVIVLP